MYGWNDKPTKAESTLTQNGVRIFEIGDFHVGVADDGTVTYEHRHHQNSDPRRTLPNMEITSGEIRIPITDLVAEILKRLEPADLARELWSDESVRELFMDDIVASWGSHWTEADRKTLLHRVSENLHAARLGRLADKLAEIEFHRGREFDRYHAIENVNAWLRDHGSELRLEREPEDPDFRIGGKVWNDARDYWRRLVLASFPEPVPDRDASDVAEKVAIEGLS